MAGFWKHAASRGARSPEDVAIEISCCTGEKMIGFRSRRTGRLEEAVLVRSQEDIDAFYRAHGMENGHPQDG